MISCHILFATYSKPKNIYIYIYILKNIALRNIRKINFGEKNDKLIIMRMRENSNFEKMQKPNNLTQE